MKPIQAGNKHETGRKINIALHFQQILHLDATSTGKVVDIVMPNRNLD